MKPRRPNILIIMSDEHAPQFSSIHGHPLVHSPNMERLAGMGVTFDNAYCNSPRSPRQWVAVRPGAAGWPMLSVNTSQHRRGRSDPPQSMITICHRWREIDTNDKVVSQAGTATSWADVACGC